MKRVSGYYHQHDTNMGKSWEIANFYKDLLTPRSHWEWGGDSRLQGTLMLAEPKKHIPDQFPVLLHKGALRVKFTVSVNEDSTHSFLYLDVVVLFYARPSPATG